MTSRDDDVGAQHVDLPGFPAAEHRCCVCGASAQFTMSHGPLSTARYVSGDPVHPRQVAHRCRQHMEEHVERLRAAMEARR